MIYGSSVEQDGPHLFAKQALSKREKSSNLLATAQ